MTLININRISHIKDSKLNQNNQINKQGVTVAAFRGCRNKKSGIGPQKGVRRAWA